MVYIKDDLTRYFIVFIGSNLWSKLLRENYTQELGCLTMFTLYTFSGQSKVQEEINSVFVVKLV